MPIGAAIPGRAYPPQPHGYAFPKIKARPGPADNKDMSAALVSEESVLRIANTFPATQQVLAQLGVLLRDSGAEVVDVTTILKRDVALASRLIRTANSAAFAQSRPVATVEDAVSLIGFQEVYRLVGVAVLNQVSDGGLPCYNLTGKKFYENSLFTGLLMEQLAPGAKEDPRYCYTVGLMRSIGKIALNRLAREAGVSDFSRFGEGDSLLDWEQSAFGMTNVEAGVAILRAWRFPHEIVLAIEGHYRPFGKHMPLTHLLNLAAGTAEVLGRGLEGETSYWIESEEVYRKAGIDPQRANQLIDRALSAFERLTRTDF
jgi:HD-like signal output (HDOD) protein